MMLVKRTEKSRERRVCNMSKKLDADWSRVANVGAVRDSLSFSLFLVVRNKGKKLYEISCIIWQWEINFSLMFFNSSFIG